MSKSQGRSSLEQYMPLKPTKRGIKVWVAADSSNGYFSCFEIYIGKKGNGTKHGLGARVVKTLTSDLKGKHHHITSTLTTILLVSVSWRISKKIRSTYVVQPEKTERAFQTCSRQISRIGVCVCACRSSCVRHACWCVQNRIHNKQCT